MQKKIKSSRSRSKLSDLFWVAVLCCFLGTLINSLLFYKSFFRALTKLNEEPVATISFKYKTAQRKFIDRVVWDRLRQNSPVYNGDTIHTQNQAEATIWFKDGNVMELDENTMAQVFLNENGGSGARLASGNMTVDSSEAEESFTVSSYGVQAVVESGSSLSASASKSSAYTDRVSGLEEKFDASVNMQVLSGNAQIETQNGGSSVIASGESASYDASGIPVKEPVLLVSKPSPNAKVLYFSGEKTKVHFSWKGKNLPENSSLILQISDDKDFKKIIARETVTNLSETDEELPEGNYFWRLKTETAAFFGDAGKEAVAEGKFSVNLSAPPAPVTPVKNYEYTFRHRKPGIRFIWHEAAFAASYRLLVSRKPDMTNPVIDQRSTSTSSIISSLGEGKYYWTVTPYYTINKIGLASPSEVQVFTVSQKGEMVPPELYLPSENGLADTDEKGRGISFSWKNEREAVSYTLKVSDNPSLKNPVISVNTSSNFYSMSGKAFASKNLKEGKWYWSVSQTDDEGNISSYGTPRGFFAMKGNPEQHTIEPLEGYKVSQSLCRDMNFTWKTNLPENYETRLQISKDESFEKPLFDSVVTGEKLKGQELSEGVYYWRVVSENLTDGSFIKTDAKSFSVVGNLPEPEMLTPSVKAVAREFTPYEFRWKEVIGADYYRFAIYRASDDEMVYSDNVYSPSVKLNLYGSKWIDRSRYYFTVQPEAIAVPGVSSRRNGDLAKSSYQLVKLRPVEIVSPSKNQKISGLDAIMNPPSVTWRSVEKTKTSRLSVRRSDTKEEVFSYPSSEQIQKEMKNAPFTVKINPEGDFGLRSGDYEVIVFAETFDGIDISNTDEKNMGRFTVLPVEPLEMAENLSVTPSVLDRNYILTSKSNAVTFSWSKVKNATDYYLEIYAGKGKTVLSQRLENTGWILDFNKIDPALRNRLKKGTFTWTVEAVRRIDTDKDGKPDKVLQEGKIASGKFSTDIPTPKASKASGAKNPYGK